MTRRQLLQLAAASGAAVLLPSGAELLAAPAAQRGSVSFLVFGDWGSGMRLQREVAGAMARFSAQHKPDFAVSVGDNFYDNGVSGHDDPQWAAKFETMYPRAAMPFPFFAVLGNHDWVTNPATQFSYRGPSGRWRMDGFYYKIAARNGLLDLFMVDTDLWLPQYHAEKLADKQTAWLDDELGRSKAKWKIVVGHHPPFTDGIHQIESDMRIVRGVVTPLLAKHGVQLMLSGHDHDLQHIVLPDAKTHFAVCGAGGASLRRRFSRNYGPFYRDLTGGFMNIEVGEKQLRARFFDAHLALLHEWKQEAVGSF